VGVVVDAAFPRRKFGGGTGLEEAGHSAPSRVFNGNLWIREFKQTRVRFPGGFEMQIGLVRVVASAPRTAFIILNQLWKRHRLCWVVR